jgi:hypothetical protein
MNIRDISVSYPDLDPHSNVSWIRICIPNVNPNAGVKTAKNDGENDFGSAFV